MTKITLNNIGTGTPFQTAISTINTNNDTLETAFDNTLSRDGTSPNTMGADLDMNSNRILNLPQPLSLTEPARLQDIGDAPTYAADAAASAAAALASETAAASSASSASTSASNASTSASNASTSATNASNSASDAAASAVTAANNATVIGGNAYAYSTTTAMADPGTGFIRGNNLTISSITAIAISALTNETGNPNIRSYIATWDDSTNTAVRGYILCRKMGTPATFAIFSISGALTDNTTWLQLAVTHIASNGTWSASDPMNIQFYRTGDKGADGLIAGSTGATDNRVLRADGVGGTTLQNSAVTIDDSGNITGAGQISSGALVPTTDDGAALGNATTNRWSDLFLASGAVINFNNGNVTITHSAGTITIAGATSFTIGNNALTAGTLELGNTTDTTLSRGSAGVIAVEGVNLTPNIPQNSRSAAYTAVLADANTHILHPSSDNNARTFTIPANASVAYPIGTTLTFVNKINTVTISINSDTLTLAGPGSTGSRTLAANGIATAMKITSTEWMISGSGLT